MQNAYKKSGTICRSIIFPGQVGLGMGIMSYEFDAENSTTNPG